MVLYLSASLVEALYQLVSKHYPVFRQQLAEEGRMLPGYVQREFEDYLKCGRLEHGFLYIPRNLLKSDFYKMGTYYEKIEGFVFSNGGLGCSTTRRVINYQPVKHTIWLDGQFYCEKIILDLTINE